MSSLLKFFATQHKSAITTSRLPQKAYEVCTQIESQHDCTCTHVLGRAPECVYTWLLKSASSSQQNKINLFINHRKREQNHKSKGMWKFSHAFLSCAPQVARLMKFIYVAYFVRILSHVRLNKLAKFSYENENSWKCNNDSIPFRL